MNMPLGFGIALAGISFGWMVGASGNPIAGTAFPVVFAVVATVFSFLSGGSRKEALEKALGNNVAPDQLPKELQKLLKDQADHTNHTTRMLGWALVCFFLGYPLGMGIGAAARIQNWFGGGVASKAVPWTAGSAPTSLSEGVEQIHLAVNLQRLGYSPKAVQEILALSKSQATVAERTFPDNWKQEDSSPESLQEAILHLELIHRLEAWGYTSETIEFLSSLPVGVANTDGKANANRSAQEDGSGGQNPGNTVVQSDLGNTTTPLPNLLPVPIPFPNPITRPLIDEGTPRDLNLFPADRLNELRTPNHDKMLFPNALEHR